MPPGHLEGQTLRTLDEGTSTTCGPPAPRPATFPAPTPTLFGIRAEVDPPQATVRNVGRLTTPLFGLGLVDAMPDSFFDGLAASEPAAVRGIVNRVPVLLPNPEDPDQHLGALRVGRFG